MDEPQEAGRDILVSIFQSLKDLHRTLYDQGFRIRAAEATLRSFPQTLPVFDALLKDEMAPEQILERDLSLKAYDSLIALARGGPHHSA